MTDELVKVEVVHTTTVMEREDLTPSVGQWYWVKGDSPWLGCVSKLGSNYVRLTSVKGGTRRFHIDTFFESTELETDPDSVIDNKIDEYQAQVRELLGRVTELTKRLAVSPHPQLKEAQPETMALSRMGQGMDIKDYQTALVKAKTTDLPDLFKQIRDANESMASWMKAKVIPLQAQAEGMKGAIDLVNDRIFSVELYAGLTEKVGQFAEGEPAVYSEKLHIMQRRCYMDEECLAEYQAGGMEFKDIRAFDEWLAEPENRDRILPFPRCMVSFRVRRNQKYRETTSISDFIQLPNLIEADKATFLYFRNGENLYWLQSSMDFGDKLFPDNGLPIFGQDLMFKMFGGHVQDDYITRENYDAMVAENVVTNAAWEVEQEERVKRGEPKRWEGAYGLHSVKDYAPFTPENVYYDDMRKRVGKEMTQYNRIALLVQGLFDRSPVFHPHAPVKTWSPEGFERSVKLVFDSDHALYASEKPDFEAYFKRLNRKLKPGDFTIAQEHIWMVREARRENERVANDWRIRQRDVREHVTFSPYGNPGPGLIAVPTKLTKRFATYRWERERLTRQYRGETDTISATIRVPRERLFNVSAYKPGDFRQFFADPRTRDEYIKWAPMLLAAEDYHAELAKPDGEEE
jgi:hypothetical protein